MTKELIWGVLVLSLILTSYLSHVEDRRHREAMAKLESRRLEIKTRMRELDEEIERQRKLKEELIEENRILRAERRAMESRAETPAEARETLRRIHATNTRVERGNR